MAQQLHSHHDNAVHYRPDAIPGVELCQWWELGPGDASRLPEKILAEPERIKRAERWRKKHATPPAVCEAFIYNPTDVWW